MPFRHIGRLPTQKGRSLYEISQQLANSGVGRVVYRTKHAENWPTQKSFFRLTQVTPDKTSTDYRKGTAWGQKIFRGHDIGEVQIATGHKSDWMLVPKHMEKEFCQITEMAELPEDPPSHFDCPPWLQLLQQKKSRTNEQIKIPLLIDNRKVKPNEEEWKFEKFTSHKPFF